jgi:Ca-activated chloride channel family protein
VLSPLTQDQELLLHLFSSLDEKNIITKGSSVMPALELSRKMSKSKKVSVVIFSDGADEFGYDAEAMFAKENSLVVNILMTATTMGGTLRQENGEFLKDELGDIVVSRENGAIKVIADATGGVYTKDIADIINALEDQRENEKESQTTIVQNMELFYYFIVLAIVTFLAATTKLKKYLLALFLFFGLNVSANENLDFFNKATNAYREGKYEEALKNYDMVKSSDTQVKAVVFYNIGNSLVRLGEFERAKEAYIKSLTLLYSKEADENLNYIRDASESKEMSTGQQQSKDKSSLAKKEQSDKKQKEGGGSNMQVSAQAGSGADEGGKKTKSQSQINLEGGKAKLSSKQYELINRREVNEKKPW